MSGHPPDIGEAEPVGGAVATASGPVQRTAPIRIMLVDDHAFFRRGLASVLEEETDIDVVGESGGGEDAVVQAARLAPDVVLMDVWMPRGNGIEACAAIRERLPAAKITMLTMSDEQEDLFEALKAGADGYLLKEISVDELPDAVRSIADGQSFINAAMAAKLIGEFTVLAKRDGVPAKGTAATQLTTRETEVLRLVARCLNNKEIADELFISENTVKNHIRNILEKLQLHSRTEAAVYAVREQVLRMD